MITLAQIKMARAALGLSQADMAKLSGISATAFNAIETGVSGPKVSTYQSIVEALEAKGAVFGRDGSVRIVPKSECFLIEPGQNPSPEERALALRIVNAGRQRDGLAPLIDEGASW